MLTPHDKFSFGKYKGELLSDIYKYFPSYIEWAVLNVSNFVIDIKSFDGLPKPMPLCSRSQLQVVDREKYNLHIANLKKDLADGTITGIGTWIAELEIENHDEKREILLNLGLYEGKTFEDFFRHMDYLTSTGVAPKAIYYSFPSAIISENEKKKNGQT